MDDAQSDSQALRSWTQCQDPGGETCLCDWHSYEELAAAIYADNAKPDHDNDASSDDEPVF